MPVIKLNERLPAETIKWIESLPIKHQRRVHRWLWTATDDISAAHFLYWIQRYKGPFRDSHVAKAYAEARREWIKNPSKDTLITLKPLSETDQWFFDRMSGLERNAVNHLNKKIYEGQP